MVTCLGDVFRPNAAMATVRVLERLGVRVHFPEEQTCCGQPFYNSGFMQGARDLARHTIQAFADDRPVVTPSGSCAAMLKIEYPHLFPDDPEWARRAEHLAARTFELSDFLVNQLMVTQLGARFEGKVAYHYACHLRGLGLKDEAESLIRNVAGVDYRPLRAQDQCCGFGGSFAVRYPGISGAMVQDKASFIEKAGVSAVVATDAGCLMNIAGCLRRRGSAVRALHLAQVLEKPG